MAVLPPDPVFVLRENYIGGINCICFHGTERLLCGTSRGTVYVWDLQTNRSTLNFSIGSIPISSIYHGEDILLTQEKGGIFKRWQVDDSCYRSDATKCTDYTGFCRFAIDEEKKFVFYPKNNNEIGASKLNDIGNLGNQCSTTLKPEKHERNEIKTLGHIMCMQSITVSSQQYVLAGYESGAFLTWDLRTNDVINISIFPECPFTFDFCSDTNHGVHGNATDKLGIFGYQRNDMNLIPRGEISMKNSGVNCIRIRRDQKIFCAGGNDGCIRVFSRKSLRPLTVLDSHRGMVNDIAYSNGHVDLWNSQIMATASSDGQISLWNLYN